MRVSMRYLVGLSYTVKNVVYIWVTMETVKYCSPGAFGYTTFFTVYVAVLDVW